MRYLLILVILLAMLPGMAHAQFAGCADEEALENGAYYTLSALNGLTVTVIAAGVGDFDPAITVYDAEGAVAVCNDNSREAAEVALTLPTAEVLPNSNTAMVKFNVPGDQGRLDYQVVVTSADGQPGEFVMIYEGAEVFPAQDVDRFIINSSQGQIDAQVPLGIYAANLQRPQKAIDPRITFRYGDNLEQVCGKSSSRTLCDGDSEDLTGSTVQMPGRDLATLNGDDVMLYFELGGEPAEFTLEVSSYQANSFGAYVLMIHSGVGGGEEE